MTTNDLLAAASRARSLDDRGEHDLALLLYCAALEAARREALASPSLLSASARAALNAGRLAVAVRLADQALVGDPLSVEAVEVLDAAALRAGALLARPERSPEDPETADLYRLLVRSGRVDPGSVLALASHHDGLGNARLASALRHAANGGHPADAPALERVG